MDGSHTSEKLLEYYDSIIHEFQIQDKLSRIVTDNASNNIKAFENLIIPGFEQYFTAENEDRIDDNTFNSNDDVHDETDNESDVNTFTSIDNSIEINMNTVKESFDNIASRSELRLPCFAHTLQLVVCDGLQEATCVKHIVAKISKIARFAHSSVLFAEKLEHIGKSIPKANKNRWNSQLNTVQKVIEIPMAELNSILTELKRKELCLSVRDWSVLNEFISLLALFGEATTITQAQNSPSISLVAPSILSIYFDLINEQTNLVYTKPLCNTLLPSLIGRFGGLLEELHIDIDMTVKKKKTYDLYRDPIFLVSSFLDGKFKLRWITDSFLSDDEKKNVSIKIQNLVLDYCIVLQNVIPVLDVNVAETQEIIVESSTCISQKRKGLFSYIENNKKKKKTAEPFQCIRDEISLFNEDECIDNMLVFHKSSVYKTLSKLATKVLCVPATSAPVERVFSQSGFLFRQHRASMSKKMLQMLTMLKCNKNLR